MNWAKYRRKLAERRLLMAFNRLLLHVQSPQNLKIIEARWLKGMDLDLQNPQKLNEKILWIEYNTDPKERIWLSDKWRVRDYVEQKGYGDTLVPLLGVFEKASEIQLENLPEKFVLKATHGCDMNLICPDKKELDQNKVQALARLWLKTGMENLAFEIHYQFLSRRIIAEALLEPWDQIVDYKFFCLNGKVEFIEVCSNRSQQLCLDLYSPNWNWLAGAVKESKRSNSRTTRPEHLDFMIRMAEDLAEVLPFVRVDLYEVHGKVYFGEMTFTPATGLLFNFTDAFLQEQGAKLLLPVCQSLFEKTETMQ